MIAVSEANPPEPSKARVLKVQGLQTHFHTTAGIVKAVDGVTFDLGRGETLAIVGESGSGKSITSLSIMRLIAKPGTIAGGEMFFTGKEAAEVDLIRATESQMRRLRGNDIAMVFQEPMTSLNPVFTVGDQITEAILLHTSLNRRQALTRATELLAEVGIPDPKRRLRDYPHQMSGGMRQRVMIAMAISCSPTLLIADEPTTALDVTVQAQILELLRKLQTETGMSILFISHNLGVVAEMADRVVVMYAGQIVENSDVHHLFASPKHPYTRALLRSMPRSRAGDESAGLQNRLESIAGTVPSPFNLPPGCLFEPRCSMAVGPCRCAVPPLEAIGPTHLSRCIRANEL